MKKNIVNLIISGILIYSGWLIFNSQSDIRILEKIQYPVLLTIFFTSILLTYLNQKNQKQAVENRWWWILFELIGIIGIAYSGFVLFVLFLFKDCCGF